MTTQVIHKRDIQPGDVYIGRPSKWGNPFVIGKDGDRLEVIGAYIGWIAEQPKLIASLPELKGKRLACYCAPELCHGDALAAMAEGRSLPREFA